jgi:hypothetical protein
MKLDYQRLKETCSRSIESFEKEGEVFDTPSGKLVYIDQGSDILAIAHRDFVCPSQHFEVVTIMGVRYILNGQLDDRLGIYTILYHLPQMGIKYDILLTENEETGNSSAQDFIPRKTYKWMFQFDRRTDDVVHYQYFNREMEMRLKKAGWNTYLHGSGSDISKMSHVGCIGINIGTGYSDEHTAWCKMNVDMWYAQVRKFSGLYADIKDETFPYVMPHPVVYQKKITTIKPPKRKCRNCKKKTSDDSDYCLKCMKIEAEELELFVKTGEAKCILCNKTAKIYSRGACAKCLSRTGSTWLTELTCTSCKKRIWFDDWSKTHGRICNWCLDPNFDDDYRGMYMR